MQHARRNFWRVLFHHLFYHFCKLMADVHSKEVRSYNMSRIRSKDTKPEMLVRSWRHKQVCEKQTKTFTTKTTKNTKKTPDTDYTDFHRLFCHFCPCKD